VSKHPSRKKGLEVGVGWSVDSASVAAWVDQGGGTKRSGSHGRSRPDTGLHGRESDASTAGREIPRKGDSE